MMGVLSSFVGGSFTRVLWLAARSVRAFTPTLPTNSAQCEPYTLSWTLDAAGDRAGPPFTLLIVPVNPPNAPNSNSTGLTGANVSPPSLVSIPDSAWNATTNTGTYSLSALPLRTGERFLIVMDDGFGYGTGGVSDIQTVGSTSNPPTSCLGPVGSASGVLFDLSSYTPAQCQTITLVTGQATDIRGFVPDGSPFGLDLPAASTGNMTTAWAVDIPTGTSFVLAYIGKDGKTAGSGLMQSQGDSGYGSTCLINPPHTTLGLQGTGTDLLSASAQSSSSTSGSGGSSSGGGINTPALIGGIIGSLAFLAIVALGLFFCIVRRTDAMGRPKSRSTGSFGGGGGGGRSTVEPYKSYDLSAASGGGGIADEAGGGGGGGNHGSGGGGGGARRAGSRSSQAKGGGGGGPAATGTLEARFGSALFGRRKKGSRSGANVGRGHYHHSSTELTSGQRRAMYPGLSIASTQNRSNGVVSGGVGVDADVEEEGYLRGRTGAVPAPPAAAVGGVVNAYREAKRREARRDAQLVRTGSDRSSLVSGNGTISSMHPTTEDDRHAGIGAGGRRGWNLTAIDEGSGYGNGSTAAGDLVGRQPRRHHSFEDSDTFHDGSSAARLLGDILSTQESPMDSKNDGFRPAAAAADLPMKSNAPSPFSPPRSSGKRPSTAPHSGVSTAPNYHLPTSLVVRSGRSNSNAGDYDGHGDGSSPPLRRHEYPPDSKRTPLDVWDSSEALNWRPGGGGAAAADIVDIIPTATVKPVGFHPYAIAQSPHPESAPLPQSHSHSLSVTTAAISIASSAVSSSGRRRGGGGGGVERHPYADPSHSHMPTEIIRHRDAGLVLSASDEEEGYDERRRRVVELPPSYGEISVGNQNYWRGRRRGGSG